jgi:hypothetical protein
MRKIYPFLLLFIVVTGLYSQTSRTKNVFVWPENSTETKPFVRWWWFGSAVDKTGITWNLEELSKSGFGGVEITPIYGVKGMESKNIPYLSADWMEMMKHTQAEAERLGLNIDMATGTGWPFGGPNISNEYAASKLILQTYTAKEGQYITEKIRVADPKQEGVAKLEVLMAFSDKGEKRNITPMVKPDGSLNWMPSEGNWKIIALFCGKTLQKVKRPAPGGEGLVMDHFSAAAFDSYTKRFNDAFDQFKCPAPKTFFNDSYEVYNADWSPVLLDEFRKRRGYNFEDYLDLFSGQGDPGDIARVKSDYRETMSDVLLESFTKRWTDWAHTKGAVTRNQAHGSPGNLIDLYATVDIPECESFGTTQYNIPGLRRDTGFIRSGDADPMMLKFASSGAHISGKKFVSSETFTWLGEHFRVSLSQCKPQLDDIFASGINHVYFHGMPYSPKEAAWPGWEFYASVNFSPNNRFWQDISAMTSYIARCQGFLQEGQPDNDFLLYFPIYDLWYDDKGTDMSFAIHSIDKWLHNSSFYKTGKTIMNMGYDLDYISDRFVKMATVSNGSILTGGNKYKALVVPVCRFIPLETFKAILNLARNGANVILVEMPSDTPGMADLNKRRAEFEAINQSLALVPFQSKDKLADLGKGKIAAGSSIEKMVGFLNIPREGILNHNIKYIRRKNSDGYHYFFTNVDSGVLNDWVSLSVDAKSVVIYDPLNGNAGLALVRKLNGKTQVRIQLKPGESVILKTFSNKEIAGNNWKYIDIAGEPIVLENNWKLIYVKGIPGIDKTFKMDKLQSWTELPDSGYKSFSGTILYAQSFTLPSVKAADWMLNLGEVRESAKIRVNGSDVVTLWSNPFACKIGKYLKKGENTIEIEVTNIDANRIADYDRRKINWKIFNDINVVNVNYKPFDASGWQPMPSGLLGPVTLEPLK